MANMQEHKRNMPKVETGEKGVKKTFREHEREFHKERQKSGNKSTGPN
ncbi:hypothetical protein [Salibacterium aidingense]